MNCTILVKSFVLCVCVFGLPLSSSSKKKCKEIEKFTPNPCDSQVFMEKCFDRCRGDKPKLTCGKKKKERKRRIVGGTNSKEGEWPWHVSLKFNGKQWCSGAILSESYILTAAHCLDPELTTPNISDWKVYSGDYFLSAKDSAEKSHEVQKIIMHENYTIVTQDVKNTYFALVHNDIAILKLKTKIDLHDRSNCASICLPDKLKSPSPNQACRIIGWGHLSHKGMQPEVLQKARVPIVPNKVCNDPEAYNQTISDEYLLCAGYRNGTVDSCNYDSGGALACLINGLWYASGIVSSGFECARPHYYGLYTNVVRYRDWVLKTILKY